MFSLRTRVALRPGPGPASPRESLDTDAVPSRVCAFAAAMLLEAVRAGCPPWNIWGRLYKAPATEKQVEFSLVFHQLSQAGGRGPFEFLTLGKEALKSK